MVDIYILGLLSYQPMSGYDVEKALQCMRVELWGNVLVGSIYHALKKLEKQEYIVIDQIVSVGKRKSKILKTTDKGELHLKELLLTSYANMQPIYPGELMSALLFRDKLSGVEIKQQLTIQKEEILNRLQELEAGKQEKAEVTKLDAITLSTFKYLAEIEKLRMQFIEDVLQNIED